MKAVQNFALGALLTLCLSFVACALLGLCIPFFELSTGAEFPRAAPGAWRSLVLIGAFQMIVGGVVAVVVKEAA